MNARRDRRRVVTVLAEDVPGGPQGQPAHKAGTEVTVIESVEVDGMGGVSFATPRPSELLLHAARTALRRAVRLRKACLKQVRRVKWGQPGIAFRFTSDDLVYDFFETAMSGVLLAYGSIDARTNEFFTEPIEHKGEIVSVEQVQGFWGVTKKLDVISAQRGAAVFDAVGITALDELKTLRDAIAHVKTPNVMGNYPGLIESGNEALIWAKLFNDADLERHGVLAESLLDALAGPRDR